MQKRRNRHTGIRPIDRFLLLLSALVLAATLARGMGIAPVQRAQEAIHVWLTGSADWGEVVQALGQFSFGDGLQAVFGEASVSTAQSEGQPAMETQAAQTSSGNPTAVFESADPSESLAARASSEFPDLVDETVYPLALTCRIPTDGAISSAFGKRTDPVDGEEAFHYGLDIAAAEGTPIYAVADGTVTRTGNNSYGIFAVVDHGSFQTLYAHCSRLDVQEGESVEGGQQIAAVGATGKATGNHLHIEFWRAGKVLNPEEYVMLT